MLDAALPLLACPVCGAGLGWRVPSRTVACAGGHAYDVSRRGYLSLLAGARPHPGDDAAMVAHRSAFLAYGHYDPVVEALAAAQAR